LRASSTSTLWIFAESGVEQAHFLGINDFLGHEGISWHVQGLHAGFGQLLFFIINHH
jgi:hypothetical protein